MTSHLKRIASPRTWKIDKQQFVFTVKPSPGAHAKERGMPLGILMRDTLHLGATMGEIRKILNNKEVLVDGRRKKDHRFNVGLFDVLSISDLNKHYRMFIDRKGYLVLKEINATESNVKVCKVVGKQVLSKGTVQYNLYDGKNFLSKEKINVGDSVLLSLPTLELKKILPLKSGIAVFLIKGKHCGETGVLKAIKGEQAVYVTDGKEVETAKDYLFVVGEKEPAIQLKN